MSMKPRVVVDEREKPSGIPDLLKGFGLQIEYRMLDVGDYLVSPEYAVERKEGRLHQIPILGQAFRPGSSSMRSL